MSNENAAPPPKADELSSMTDLQRVDVGARLDDVEILHREERFPRGSKGEKRGERIVASCFLVTFVASVAFVVIYIAWPWQYERGEQSFLSYWTYTPALGICMALALAGLGVGVIAWGKLLMPHEVAVQQRHDGGSNEVDRETAASTVRDGLLGYTGLPRRKLIRRSLGLGAAALGVMAVAPLGGFIVRPNGELSSSAWRNGMRLVRDDGRPVRPDDMQPGSIETVFPPVPGGNRMPDTPTMLIRLPEGQRVVPRPGRENYAWFDFVAFSKICTHAGCPVSLYEQQSGRILCPCHQSQFDVQHDARPVFGPATRSLPQLPIDVDDEGFFIATGDYSGPIGPAYWERG